MIGSMWWADGQTQTVMHQLRYVRRYMVWACDRRHRTRPAAGPGRHGVSDRLGGTSSENLASRLEGLECSILSAD